MKFNELIIIMSMSEDMMEIAVPYHADKSFAEQDIRDMLGYFGCELEYYTLYNKTSSTLDWRKADSVMVHYKKFE